MADEKKVGHPKEDYQVDKKKKADEGKEPKKKAESDEE